MPEMRIYLDSNSIVQIGEMTKESVEGMWKDFVTWFPIKIIETVNIE